MISLDELRPDRDGPTMRDLAELARLANDGDVDGMDYYLERMGFDARDWGDTRRPRRHRSFDPPVPVYRWVRRARLSREIAKHPELVDDARGHLSGMLDRHAEAHGLTVIDVTWATAELADPYQFELELAARLAPRLDGEWASIRQAIEEDQVDREEAVTRADLEGRLDALERSVGVATAKTPAEVREALEALPPSRTHAV